jgi:hypothetical protein
MSTVDLSRQNMMLEAFQERIVVLQLNFNSNLEHLFRRKTDTVSSTEAMPIDNHSHKMTRIK